MNVDPLFIRLYLDEDVFPDLAAVVRLHGFNCISAHEVGALPMSDEEHLALATSLQRCILGFNARHFEPLARNWAQAGREHAAIVMTRQVPAASLESC